METDSFKLSQEELDILAEQIIEEETATLSTVEIPVFYLVGAQPGSGKTEIIHLIRNELRGNVLICNVDDLRDRHPAHIEILKNHEADYPDITWSCANYWNTSLKHYGVKHRLNILIETTLQDLKLVTNEFRNMKRNGYLTNLLVLAVPARSSWLGTKLRYEVVKEKAGVARPVSDEAHDIRFDKLQENLPQLINSGDVDLLRLFKREVTVEHCASSALVQLTTSREDFYERYNDVVLKAIDTAGLADYFTTGARVIELMKKRRASQEEIDLFNISFNEKLQG